MSEAIEPNWHNYRNTFPERYWKPSTFDTEVLKKTSQHFGGRCLDVGGGLYGTEVLRTSGMSTYLLDPFISDHPTWMSGKIDWNEETKPFDLIVLRGSINYLQHNEFEYLKKCLRKGGTLIANTFLNPPSEQWSERQVVNGYGIMGVEKVRLNINKVEHILIYPDSTIKHEFFHYSKECWENEFPNILWTQHGANSYTMQWVKP